MKLVLPLPPNMANGSLSRAHWATKRRAKEAYWKKCDNRQLTGDAPAPPKKPHARVSAFVDLYLHQFMDEDNASARLKWVWDWLVTRGYLMDDRKQNVELRGITQFIDRKNQRIEIEMEAA